MCESGRCWMPLVPALTGLPGPAAVSSASSSQPGWSPWLLRYHTPRVPRPARYHELDRLPCPLRRSADILPARDVRAVQSVTAMAVPGLCDAVPRQAWCSSCPGWPSPIRFRCLRAVGESAERRSALAAIRRCCQHELRVCPRQGRRGDGHGGNGLIRVCDIVSGPRSVSPGTGRVFTRCHPPPVDDPAPATP